MAANLAESSSPAIAIADRDSEETESNKDVEETVEVVSLLERLKAPKKSDLSRKRNEALVVSTIKARPKRFPVSHSRNPQYIMLKRALKTHTL